MDQISPSPSASGTDNITRVPRENNDSKPQDRMTAYGFFLQTCEEEHKKKHPDENIVISEFWEKCAERWKIMSHKEKHKFHEMAEKNNLRYDTEVQTYAPSEARKRGKDRKHIEDPKVPDKISVGVLTVSDRCYRREAVDESGPELINMIENGIVKNGEILKIALVPDYKEDIEKVLKDWCDDGIHLILTTGGTGVADRDVTPEATLSVLTKTIPGISNLIFNNNIKQTPFAALSRGVAGVRKKSLIINFPGSKKASRECLQAVASVIPHAIDLITERKEKIERMHTSMRTKKSSVVVESPVERKRESLYPCISVTEAQKIITEKVFLLKKEKVVKYKRAHDYVSAQDVVAQDHLPPYDVSIKDGYAVLSSDPMMDLKVIGISHTGDLPLDVNITQGCCVRVSTGAAIPPGADSVVQVEDTYVSSLSGNGMEEKKIGLRIRPKKGQDIRKIGADFTMGELLLKSGTHLDSSAIGLLAAAGVTSVKVFDKPFVAVISTGDELVDPEEGIKAGKIRDSNRITLINLLKEENIQVVDLGIAADNPDALRDLLEKGFQTADVVVTTGSMSMGERDYLKEVLIADFNAEICFGRVWVKPGKPTSFGIVMYEEKPKLWFGLPGNPASAFVTSHLFLLPALRKISGREKIFPISMKALVKEWVPLEDRPQYVRGVLTYNEEDDLWTAAVTGDQRSSRIKSCVSANCLLEFPGTFQLNSVGLNDKIVKVKALLIGKSYT